MSNFHRPSELRKILRQSIMNSNILAQEICIQPDISSHRRQIIEIKYNLSNYPKYYGKFFNIRVNGKLRRECSICGNSYGDLHGFNRHYDRKHKSE